MKYQVLFSMKNNEKVFINVVCCSRDWHSLRVEESSISPRNTREVLGFTYYYYRHNLVTSKYKCFTVVQFYCITIFSKAW